jgi:hypothetical protein
VPDIPGPRWRRGPPNGRGRRFAGDDSLLVRLERGAGIDYVVVVRVADLVATLTYSDGPEADARDMAAAMEARLR